MDKPLILCGKVFTAEFVSYLNERLQADPALSNNALARMICEHLAWWSSVGQAAVASAKKAIAKLQRRGLLCWPGAKRQAKRSHRLRPSGQTLPKVQQLPPRVEEIVGLRLHLLSGHEDPLHGLWNDLMIQQHPCGDAPLVGPQLRYLIGSEHGWLGALGFGPAAFLLGARDQWIGWSTAARVAHLREVVGLNRFLIRQEVRCGRLASKVLSLALGRVKEDWQARYGVEPLLVETFVDRTRFMGLSLAAANWKRIGCSTGQGRLGPKAGATTAKDIWVYDLAGQARSALSKEELPPVIPCPLIQSLSQSQWCAQEMGGLDLGDRRLSKRATQILEARWAKPTASFYGSFEGWTPAKGAYSFIEHESPLISLDSLLVPHGQATRARMAAEPVVLLVQDTTGLNYTGLRQTQGLGPLGEDKGRGLWLHSLLAFRPDGLPLGLLGVKCWARPPEPEKPQHGRNAKSIDEKESVRWVEALGVSAQAARLMRQTQVVAITDREGDLYEMYDQVLVGPPNLHTVIRAQHERNLEDHQKLWAWMAAQPLGDTRTVDVPRHRGQPARQATVEVRWSSITIEAPKVGCKKGWPSLKLWAVWVHEPDPPAGLEAIDWMLLTDMPIAHGQEAWEKVQWYCRRWGIEEWHRVLKSGCRVEKREFKTAEHLQRVLAFDLIVAWRVMACLKAGRTHPELPATAFYTPVELAVLGAALKKRTATLRALHAG
jgi:Domain of unknown function (DUF4338)/Transposase DNA-binding